MKLLNGILAVILAVAVVACNSEKPADETAQQSTVLGPLTDGTYKLDSGTQIKWEGGKKVTTDKHFGKINVSKGEFMVANGIITGGSFEVDMKSITDEDVTDKGMNAKLVGHLKDTAFFGVDVYPTATFTITKVESDSTTGKMKITGDFKLKDITNSITFDAEVKQQDANTVVTVAKFDIDRSRWNVRYGSESFFNNLGDKVIKNEITLELNLTARK